ncbi:MAG: superinfection immunity protein [Xanthobacteraceae bacterium]
MYFWSYSFAWPPVGLLLLHWLLALLVLMFFAFVPSVIAFVRHHHNRYAILVLNVLLGWTVIGWAMALVWSLTATWHRSSPATYET